jgi:hypothetical protein
VQLRSSTSSKRWTCDRATVSGGSAIPCGTPQPRTTPQPRSAQIIPVVVWEEGGLPRIDKQPPIDMTTFTKSGRALRSFASREEMVASELKSPPIAVGGQLVNQGTVGELNADSASAPLTDNFSMELDNPGITNLTFILGDPTGGIAVQAGGVFNDPTACSFDGAVAGSGVAAMKAMFGLRPIAISGINYETSTDARQLSQKLSMIGADVNGTFTRTPLNVAINRRNNQFDDLLITLALVNPFTFTPFRALTLVVLPGETVNLDFSVYMLG